MKITKISYSLDTTINMGNYENYKPQVMAEAHIEEGDDLQQCMSELKKFVQGQLMADVKKIRESRQNNQNNQNNS